MKSVERSRHSHSKIIDHLDVTSAFSLIYLIGNEIN